MGEIFYCYYENSNGDKVIINSRTKEIKTYGYEEYKMFNKSKTIYHMMKGFDANEEGLNKYVNDFKEWATELKNNKVLNIDVVRSVLIIPPCFRLKRVSNLSLCSKRLWA